MAIIELDSPPGLTSMYARAAVGALPLAKYLPLVQQPSGEALPDAQFRLAGQRIDRDHLAAYQRVCGWRVSDVLPPTYLHVLAFPVTVRLMTEPGFPFPLMGLVHLRNAISVFRPVTADEVVDFDVRATQLGEHPAGRTVEFEVIAAVDGETVWTGHSTYLRRERSSGERPPRVPSEEREAVGATALIRVPGDIGRRYGAVSGDRNPIHVAGLTAKAFGFKSAIAHGMWVKARALASLEGRLPAGPYTVDVAFKTPVFIPSTIAVSTVQIPDGWDLDVRAARDGRPHLSGTVRNG